MKTESRGVACLVVNVSLENAASRQQCGWNGVEGRMYRRISIVIKEKAAH